MDRSFFVVHSNSRRNIDRFLGEQTWKTIPHFNDVVDLFDLLHINRIDWRLLDEFKTNSILVTINILSHKYVRGIVRHNAYRMDTSY